MKHLLLITSMMCAAASVFAGTHSVMSPDGRIELSFSNDGGMPVYAVSVDGRDLISPSALGVVASNWKYSTVGDVTVARDSHDEAAAVG